MKIKLNSLVRTYMINEKKVQAVQNISLNIPSNKVYGIIGKSGAGKSTLVRLISLLEKCDSGEIFYDDERVDNLNKFQLINRRRRIGMIFQNFNLFSSRTAAQNVAYPLEICKKSKSEIKKRVAELLSLVGLADRADSAISTLSGGEKQRVAIARALANNPDILFCDEATSALDPQTTRAILSLIREIQQKMNLTVVMITHQMEVVRDACDEVAVLEKGSVVEVGKVSDIFLRPQSAVTKEFLAHLSTVDPTVSTPNLLRWSNDGGKYILRFVGSKTGEPVLSRLSKKYNVEFNIRAGGIQHLSEGDVGTMILDIMGEKKEIDNALDYLQKEGIIIEENGEVS
ncbi:MAG: methionine ABC transporter ATP-binding protein [Treponema sp.]|nr:methionine ABC transporter ATP-binding protein [Treponema sp.]